MENKNEQRFCLWNWMFGRRSLWGMLFGPNFSDKNTAASIVAIILVSTVCYVVVWKEKYDYLPQLLNLVFVVVGYYFAQKMSVNKRDDADSEQ